jgi:hypothetical protein
MDIRGQEPTTVWQRLTHHEIKVVFAHARRAGSCGGRRVRNRRPHGRGDCSSPRYDGTLDDIWPDDPGYDQPGDDADVTGAD